MKYKKTKNKIPKVKGVSTKGLTQMQAAKLQQHANHHTPQHIKKMIEQMKKGKSFEISHNLIMKNLLK